MSDFSRQLIAWYREHARVLPWRENRDAYRIWISEIMLQQTTVSAVIPYFQRWMEAYPTVEHVAKADEQEILNLWQGLGYYSRARNIRKAAQIICDVHNGQLPQTAKELQALPGIGTYTVGAILSIAFDQRAPLVDANVRRVFMRLLARPGVAEPSHDSAILEKLDQWMPSSDNHSFNQALMELGAMICRPSSPQCLLCPVQSHCQAYAQGLQESIPQAKKRRLKNVSAAIAVIERDGKYLIQKRGPKGLFAGLWEFPGGKQEPKEPIRQTLKREVQEELGATVLKAKPLGKFTHYYTQFCATLQTYLCTIAEEISENDQRKWVTQEQLDDYPMPAGSVKIVQALKKIGDGVH